jgi:hypothetical protein
MLMQLKSELYRKLEKIRHVHNCIITALLDLVHHPVMEYNVLVTGSAPILKREVPTWLGFTETANPSHRMANDLD